MTRSNLPPIWRIDDRTGALVDQRSGRSFNMGDTITVRIAAVDLARRQMDLVVDDAASRAAGKARKPLLKLDSEGRPLSGAGGGLGGGHGIGFGSTAGSERRSRKSKARDKAKRDFRKERRQGGKR